MLDYTGKEIKVGDTVRHAYEPYPGKDHKGGHHCHYFSGRAKVVELNSGGTVLVGPGSGARIPVFISEHLEVIPENLAWGSPYIVPLGGK